MSLRRISTHQRHGQSTKRAGDGICDRNQVHDFYKPKTAQNSPKSKRWWWTLVEIGGHWWTRRCTRRCSHGTSMSSLPGMNQLFSQGKNGRYRSTNGDAAAETTQGQLPWACPCQWPSDLGFNYRSKIDSRKGWYCDISLKQPVKIRTGWVLAARVKLCIRSQTLSYSQDCMWLLVFCPIIYTHSMLHMLLV